VAVKNPVVLQGLLLTSKSRGGPSFHHLISEVPEETHIEKQQQRGLLERRNVASGATILEKGSRNRGMETEADLGGEFVRLRKGKENYRDSSAESIGTFFF